LPDKRNDSSVYTAFKGGARAMKKRIGILVACTVAMTVVSGGVYADTIRPIQGKRIDLGTFGGVAYYTAKARRLSLGRHVNA
jgi:hypothetical protein